ncbi:MAG: ubiquinol-cytochrome c reductase iron-sulfur subunit [Maricaulaceae bacterium]|nr:ubiquinol-cytochrome c reductase iron-sulfur subunit [Maricaulaceae bacterium]
MTKAAAQADHAAEPTRRDFIHIATGGMAVIGGALVLWPFIDQMNPAADTLALASIRIDISPIAEGQEITVMWRGGPVFIRHRSEREIEAARAEALEALPDRLARNDNLPDNAPATDENRSAASIEGGSAAFLIMRGNCTHLGCVPLKEAGDYHGWYCPCHGSHYDTSGRIRRGPAPENLSVPPLRFVTETEVQIG